MVQRSPDSLIEFIYPGIDGPTSLPNYFLERTILAARNTDVSGLNDTVLDRMTGEARTFISADKIITKAGADDPEMNDAIPVEYLR
ncbi:hypothetical protein B0H15DRAFT_794076 [Mycena belliarum]|uniref:ATP-dependent DNA helicase n=1 Tax=Mycena belliarum TaxID=1033014 RepID=A0AAD6TQQ5_9AGAR|nr:hypothetical protein B0H15DRAFT_794076 [Mycena belliae]